MSKRLNTARDIYQRLFSGKAHTAYQTAQTARASGDTAAYRQAATDFANSVNGLQTIIETDISATPKVAEAIQILNAVSVSMGRDMEMKSGGGNVSIDLAPGMEVTPTSDELVATDRLKEYNIITTQGGATEHGGETRQEDRQAFRQRSVSEGLAVIEGDSADYGYKRVSGTAQRARQVQAELEKLGVEVDVIDGTVWRNQDGVSVKRTVSEAVTIGGRKVLVSSSVTLPAKYVAGHEAFHRWKNTPGRQRYIDTLEENLDFSSRAFLNYQSEIAKAYLGGEVDLTDSAQLQALQEELFAYLSGDLHEGGHDEELRLMFRDFDAVKMAWAALVAQQTKSEKVAFDGLAPAVKAPTKTPAQLAHEAKVLSGLPIVDHLGPFGRSGLTHLLESHGAVGDAEASWNVIDGYMDLYLAGFDRRPVSQDILPADATPATRRLTAPERLQAYYNGLNDAGVMGQDRTEWGTTQTPGDLESGEDIQESERGDKARHVGKSILSGGRTTGFEGLTEDMRQAFREGLKTASPETQELLRQWKRKAQYRLAPSKRSYYRTSKGVITIGRNATASTVAHELFHWVDDGGRISSQLLDPLMQDYVALKMASEGSVKEYLIDRFPEAFKMRGKKRQTMVMRSEYRGISDVLNGLSGGKEHYGYGHSKKYWERAGALEAEAWAQLGRHLYENMDMPLQMFQELFPNLYRSAIIKLKELK